MKELLALILVVVLMLSMAACGEVEKPQTSGGVDWPTKDVKILTTVKVGGNMDIKARLVGKYLAAELGVKSVTIENIPGGGGVTGMTQYLAEKPNTHTLIYMGVPHLTIAPFFNEVKYSKSDITILSALDTVENGLFVSKKSGLKNLEDVIKLGKDGGIIKFGSAGVNNDTYLFTKALFEMAGAKSDSIDAGSSAESIVNCIAGTVDVVYSAMNLAKGYVETGDLIPIGVFSQESYKGYAGIEVKSFASQGYDLVYKATSLFAIRSGTDEAITQKLEKALANVFANPDFQKEFKTAGYVMMEDKSAATIDNEITNVLKTLDEIKPLFKK